MSTSELITPAHLARKALIYIRQSSPQQVLSHQESLRLQYALQQRALDLGWPPEAIEVIDADLGLTGATAEHREGFKELIAQVTLGQVGMILSFDVTRLARNCSDWYPLLDVCGYRGCLIGDYDGVYNPGTPNGRLLLGIKGQLSELELHTLCARMQTGLLNKAQRGDLAVRLPIGLVRNELDEVVKNPDWAIQHCLDLVFSTFLRRQTAHQVVRYFREQSLLIPGYDRLGKIIWKKPSSSAILRILKCPAYAGAFVYGKTREVTDAAGQTKRVCLPRDQWPICVHDKYPAYISWETFEKIQKMLEDNYARYHPDKPAPGVPRGGEALLHGLVFCGKCGHQMRVHYKTKSHAYLCDRLKAQYQAPQCQRISGTPIDTYVLEAFFQALSPVELDVYERSLAAQMAAEEQLDQAQQQQLERLRYQAALAERQFNRVDPDNRLVAAELEKRWEAALRDLKQAEDTYAQQQQKRQVPAPIPAELKEAFTAIGQKLPHIWHQGILTQTQKKALLRCLIDKVVLDRDRPERTQVRIVWRGGDTSSLSVPTPVPDLSVLPEADEMKELILELYNQGLSDEEIAEQLTTLGYRSPLRTNVVLTNTVRDIRLRHGRLRPRGGMPPLAVPGYLTVPQLAHLLGVTPEWFYYRIRIGKIQIRKDAEAGIYLFPDNADTVTQLRRFQAGACDSVSFSDRVDGNESVG